MVCSLFDIQLCAVNGCLRSQICTLRQTNALTFAKCGAIQVSFIKKAGLWFGWHPNRHFQMFFLYYISQTSCLLHLIIKLVVELWWKVLVFLILSFCCLRRNLKIKWEDDLRNGRLHCRSCLNKLFGQLFFCGRLLTIIKYLSQEWILSCGHMSTHMRGFGLSMATRSAITFQNHSSCLFSLWFRSMKETYCAFLFRYTMEAKSSLTWTPKLQYTLSLALL